MTQTAALITRLREARDAAGLTRREMYRRAGRSPVESNWAKNPDGSQTLKTIDDLAWACGVDPEWLAYGGHAIPTGHTGRAMPRRALQRDPAQDTAPGFARLYSIWDAVDGHLDQRLWYELERQGLIRSTYLFWEDAGHLRYAVLGAHLIGVLGLDWWVSAPGQILGDNDPDPAMAEWCLPDYRRALAEWRPLLHDCVVTSRYRPDPLPCRYDRFLLPCLSGNKRALLVIVRLKPAFDGVGK